MNQGYQGNNQGYQGTSQNYQGSYPNNIPTYQGGYQGRRPYPPQNQGPTNEDVIKTYSVNFIICLQFVIIICYTFLRDLINQIKFR